MNARLPFVVVFGRQKTDDRGRICRGLPRLFNALFLFCRPSSVVCPPSSVFLMQRKVIISCAVTGSADTPGRNPAVPVTPEQIATSAIDAAKAGAAIVHIHVRHPQTGKPSMDGAHYR